MEPTIQSTEFGSITVDHETYDHDIVIRLPIIGKEGTEAMRGETCCDKACTGSPERK